MSDVLTYLDTADRLLGSFPTRQSIAGSPKLPIRRTVKIRVDRTIPFEFIGKWIPAFCGLWGAEVRFDYSDYDSALSGIGGDGQADVYFIWLDWRIYRKSMSPIEAADWLMERIGHLRGKTNHTIWVNNWPDAMDIGDRLFDFRIVATERGWMRKLNAHLADRIENAAGCGLVDLAGLAQEIEGSFFDDRNEAMSSYPFSDLATMLMARHLGVHLLPAVAMPRLKAIALDLDDTLYRGVLGEEGSGGVQLSEGHYALQKLLLKLKQSGILLSICSRNEEEDVKELFENRDDFPLKWTDFAAVCANWQPKADNFMQLVRTINIDPSAFLFLDDNSVELLKMAAAWPEVCLLRADRDGTITMNKLCHFPGLYQIHPDGEASSRTHDIQANQKRESMKQGASGYDEYLENLKMVVSVYENEPSHAGRLYDLSRKTNQFNLALRRMTETEAQEVMDTENYVTLTIRLQDLLSDSGLIGAFVCRLEGRHARILETLFSCRALGREIETVSFACLLEILASRGVERVTIDATEGPRNRPARDWLNRFVPDASDSVVLSDLLVAVKSQCLEHPAMMEVIS